uniref:ANK_REP_REGION domain-containing protein n=1 Tax=Macrostomum lignano TaxID=282301 RepID=A0A1I8JSF8_9PLAT
PAMGVCDPDCDTGLACDWDGGDCASGWQPWANCTAEPGGGTPAAASPAAMATALCQAGVQRRSAACSTAATGDASTSRPLRPRVRKLLQRRTSLTADATLVATPARHTAAYLFDVATVCRPVPTGKLPPQPRDAPPPPARSPPPRRGYLKLAVGGRNASGFPGLTQRWAGSLSAASASDSAVWFSWRPSASAAVSSGDGTVVLVLVYRLGLCHRPDRCYTQRAIMQLRHSPRDLRLESSASSTAAGRRRPRPSLTLPLIGVSAAAAACCGATDPLVSRDSMLLPAVVGCVWPVNHRHLIGVLFSHALNRRPRPLRDPPRSAAAPDDAKPAGCALNSVSSSGGGCGCGHPDNECPGAAYSMQHRQHPLLLDDSFEQPAAKRSKRCCSTDAELSTIICAHTTEQQQQAAVGASSNPAAAEALASRQICFSLTALAPHSQCLLLQQQQQAISLLSFAALLLLLRPRLPPGVFPRAPRFPTKPQTVSMLTSLTDGDSPGCVAATSSQPAPSDTPIHTVISAGTCVEGPPSDKTVEMIRQLLDNGYSAEAQSEPWGETPLHLAARYCRVDAVQTLLEFGGVDPNRRDRFGRTPLHLAIASGANGVCHLLMRDRRTDLNAKAHDGTTPLMVSASYLVKDVEVAAALTADPQVCPVPGLRCFIIVTSRPALNYCK